VLTNPSGQILEFDADGPYVGVQIRLDSQFVYQFPMPLFQTGQQLWPISSESVKEQVSEIVADKSTQTLASVLISQSNARLPEKVPKFGVLERLVL
jgi:hypothetical protein